MGGKLYESVKQDGTHYAWLWFCPGCESIHMCDARWTWNGDKEKPTFRASVLVYGEAEINRPRCHSFVTDGRIEFLSDSTHALKGQTVDLPDWPEDAFRRERS